MTRQEVGLQVIEDCGRQWKQIVTPDAAEATLDKISQLRMRWTDLQERLRRWMDSLQLMRKEGEGLWKEYEEAVGAMKLWLDAADITANEVADGRLSSQHSADMLAVRNFFSFLI